MAKRKLNIAIIDDEQHAIETLVYDLREAFREKINIQFTANNPFEGARQVRIHKPDLLFLDIVMPGLSGFDLISLIDDLNTRVVFTTAFMELQQQNVNSRTLACLMKPVLLTDIERIFERIYNLQSK
jgi:DNA-binding LytR/AlgR family response regulator